MSIVLDFLYVEHLRKMKKKKGTIRKTEEREGKGERVRNGGREGEREEREEGGETNNESEENCLNKQHPKMRKTLNKRA